MNRNDVKKRLKILAGEGDTIMEMMGAGCETRPQWAQMLQGPLERACDVGNTGLVTKLVLAGARVTEKSFNNTATRGKWDTLLELLSRTRKEDLDKISLVQALCLSIAKKQNRVARAFLDTGAVKKLGNALILAVRNAGDDSSEKMLGHLLDHPGAADVIDWFGHGMDNPLNIAARRGRHQLCFMLLVRGANVNAQRTSSEPTALHNAVAISRDLRTVQVLLQAGANPNVPCGIGGRTTVHTACQQGDSCAGILGALFESGADVKASDDRRITPLHIACGVSPTCPLIIRLLVAAGANINAKKMGGRTPLHSAAGHVRVEALKTLLWHGADETIAANSGKTPRDVVGDRKTLLSGQTLVDAKRIYELLDRAPAERAWKRRSCIVLCRARATSTTAETAPTRKVRRSPRLSSGNFDGFGGILREVSDDVFRKIVGYL